MGEGEACECRSGRRPALQVDGDQLSDLGGGGQTDALSTAIRASSARLLPFNEPEVLSALQPLVSTWVLTCMGGDAVR